MPAALDKITHLQEINKKLDVYFDYQDDDARKRGVLDTAVNAAGNTAKAVGAGGIGAGVLYGRGLLAQNSVNKSALTSGLAKQTPLQTMTRGAGALGGDMKGAAKTGVSALKKILGSFRGLLSSKEEEIQFEEPEDKPKSKIPGLLGKGLVLGGIGYGGFGIHKLIKYGGGYKKVGSQLGGAIKRGFKLSSRQEKLIELNSRIDSLT